MQHRIIFFSRLGVRILRNVSNTWWFWWATQGLERSCVLKKGVCFGESELQAMNDGTRVGEGVSGSSLSIDGVQLSKLSFCMILESYRETFSNCKGYFCEFCFLLLYLGDRTVVWLCLNFQLEPVFQKVSPCEEIGVQKGGYQKSFKQVFCPKGPKNNFLINFIVRTCHRMPLGNKETIFRRWWLTVNHAKPMESVNSDWLLKKTQTHCNSLTCFTRWLETWCE